MLRIKNQIPPVESCRVSSFLDGWLNTFCILHDILNLRPQGGVMAMTYATVTHWAVSEWSDELDQIGQEKFVPMILSAGAASVSMIRTSESELTVVTFYSDAETARAAQDRIKQIREQAATTLPLRMTSQHDGEVIASGP
jgi:hypothetical protein